MKSMRRLINMNKISVIIPIKNEADKIERFLEAVFNQSFEPHEVIVVDGHSTDKTVENAMKLPVEVVYEDHGAVGGARQVGVDNAKAEFVAFKDADCIPETSWSEDLMVKFSNDIVGDGRGMIQ